MPPIKAYRNIEFLTSTDARTLRILSEYLEPEARFEKEGVDNTVVFFGSARVKPREEVGQSLSAAQNRGAPEEMLRELQSQLKLSRYYEDARELANMLTVWSKSLGDGKEAFVVSSGGGPGIMEAANRGASEAGGRSVGLNISLPREVGSNPYITDELNLEFHYFFMRKLWFVQLACAIVIFPGGYGTLDELGEVLTLMQTARSRQMPTVVYGRKFWDEVLDFEALKRWGVISPEDLDLFNWADSPTEAFDYLQEGLSARFS